MRLITSLTQNHSVAKAIAVNPNIQATSLLRRRAQLLLLLIALTMCGMKGWGQQSVIWRSEAANGNFENGSNTCNSIGQVNSQWWYPGFSPNESRNNPACSDGSTTRHNITFDNNAWTAMTVNNAFWGVRALTLTANASNGRTFTGSPDNNTRGISFTNGLYNNSNSGVTHTFNTFIGIDANPVILRTTTSGATTTFGREIFGNANTIQFDGAGTTNVTATISGSGASVTKLESGTLVLSGTNSYTGTTTISAGIARAGSTVAASTNGAFGNNASGLNLNGGTIQSNTATFSRPITVTATNSGLDAFTSARTISSNITMATASNTFNLNVGGTTAANAAGQDLTLSGIIANSSGTLNLTKIGSSTVIISNTNTYTGTTTVSAGILRANATVAASTNGAFGNNASGLNLNGGTIQSNTTTFSRPITVTATNSGLDAWGSARTISSNITLATAGSFNLNVGGTTAASAAGQELTLSGIIGNSSGTLSLTKIGNSTVVLSNANTYSGSTIINAGTLTLGAANALPVGSSAGVIQFAGTSTINLGAFNLGTSTSSSNSAGVLDFDASTTINLPTAIGSYNYFFKASNGQGWSVADGGVTINNWVGVPGIGGSRSKIFIGSSASLSIAELAKFSFTGYTGCTQLSTGEIIPTGPFNPGFETSGSVVTGWDVQVSGGEPTANGISGTSRSGSRAFTATTTTTANRYIEFTPYSITVPNDVQTNHIHIIGYARSGSTNIRAFMGARRLDNSGTTGAASANIALTNTWQRYSHSVTATNGASYTPRFSYNTASALSTSVLFDDIIIYTSTTSTIDFTAPNAPTSLSSSSTGANVQVSWTAGADNATDISGIDGVLILRTAGTGKTAPTPNNQAWYSTSSAVGPTSIVNGGDTWTVISNGNPSSPLVDASSNSADATGYTYAIYMRDKAFNYSAAATVNYVACLATYSSVASSSAALCTGSNATITVSGLQNSTAHTITYSIGATTGLTATPTSNGSGVATFTITPTLAQSGATLTITAVSNGSCTINPSSSKTATLPTVSDNPTTSTNGGNLSVCKGASSVTSAALGGNTPTVGTGAWSCTAAPAGGNTSDITFTSISTGNTTAIVAAPAVAGAYTLAWTITNSPCTASQSTLTLTVNARPDAPTGPTNGTVCTSGSTTISVSNPGANLTVDWYAASSGGTVLSGGQGVTSFTTPTISTATTYHAETRNTITGCVSTGRTGVSVSIVTPLGFVNTQFPITAQTITAGDNFTAYGRVYKDGLTPTAGAPAGVSAWLGYSSTNSDPSGGGWTWVAASYNTQVGNDDEFIGTLSGLTTGTYFYAWRYQLSGCSFQYGGTSGNWSSTAHNVQLTVNPGAPIINSTGGVVASSPGSGTSGYVGNTITINGNNLNLVTTVKVGGSGGTTVTILSQTASTLTFAAINAGGQIYVASSTANATSAESYTNLGYISNASTDWNTPGTWLGGDLPAANSTVTINHDVTINSDVSNAINSITVNSTKSLTFGASGTITATTLTNNGSVVMTAGGTLTIASGGTLANGTNTFTRGSGTVAFAGSGSITGTIAMNNVTVAGGVTVGSSITVHGTLSINPGGFLNNAPTWASGSTLNINTGGPYNLYTGTTGSVGWFRNVASNGSAQEGIPWNFSITNNTAVVFNNVTDNFARYLNGSINIVSGSFTLDGSLYLRGDWTNSGTFTPGSNTVFFNGTSAQTINSATTFNGLTLDNTAGLTLAASPTVNGTLTLTNGIITLGSNNLTLGASSTISGTPSDSRMIVATGSGELRKTYSGTGSFTFPVGDNTGTAEYSPVTLNFTSGSFSSAYAGVKLSNAKYGSNTSASNFINRFWSVSTSGITSPVCTASFQYADGDIQGAENALYGGRYASSTWNCMDIVNTSTNTFSKTGITAFGDFTAGEYEIMGCCADPTTQASGISFNSVGATGMNISWSGSGNGDGVIVVMKAGSAPTDPSDNTSYTADATFTGGTNIGSDGSYVVYIGSGNNVTVSNLSASTTYHVEVFSKNCSGTNIKINTTSPASSSRITLAPELAAHPASFTASSTIGGQVDLTYSAANTITNAAGYIILQRQAASAPTGTPADGTSYTVGGTIGDGTIVDIVTDITQTSSSITGLNISTQYFYAIYAYSYNGSNSLTYNYYTAVGFKTATATTPSAQTWYSRATGPWNDNNTWSTTSFAGSAGSGFPSASDVVHIGGGFEVTASANANCGQLNFTGTAGTLKVNNTITVAVSGAIQIPQSGSQSNAGTITGDGTVTCSSISIGGSAPSLSGNRTTTLTSTINALTSSGAITLTARDFGGYINDPFLYIQSGSVSCTGITTVHPVGGGTTATVSLASAPQTGRLNLTGGTPFTIDTDGDNTITLNGTGATVEYSASGVQTVRNTSYTNLTLSGSGNKTLSAFSISGTLSVEGSARGITTAPTFGASSTLQYKNVGNITTNAIEWPASNGPSNLIIDNSGSTVTMLASANRTLSGNLTLTAGTLADNGNILTVQNNIGGTATHSGSGSITMTGASKTISGATLGNLTLNNAGGFSLSGSPTINGVLTFTAGKLTIGSNTLNLAGTVASMTAANSITGSSTSNLNITGTGSLGTLFFDAATGGTTNLLNNLSLNRTSSGAITLGNDLFVNGTSTFTSGVVTIGTNNITFGPSAAISGTPSSTAMILADGGGQIRKIYNSTGSFAFPVGDNTNTVEYSPVTVNMTAGSGFSTSNYVAVTLVDAKHPNNASTSHFISRYWNIIPSGITGTATITGTYPAADINGTEGSSKAAQLNGTFNQASNPWVKTGGSNLSSNTLTYTGASLASGTTSVFTSITSADPTVSISGGNTTVCQNASVTLTANPVGDASFTYLWDNSLGTSTTASPSTSSAGSTNYSVTVKDGNGISATSSTVSVAVDATSVGGTATAGAAEVCLNAGTSVSLTGNTGTIQWQRSENGGTDWANISGATSSSYNTPNLITATSYRSVVTNGVCPSANSTSTTVSITQANTSTAGATTYNSGWTNGANDGVTGLGAWTLSPSTNGANSGFYISSASDVDVKNSNTRAWALYGKNGGTASAVRSVSMSVGNTVSFSMDNGFVNGTIGAAIQNASGENLMELIFIGGDARYKIVDAAGTFTTSVNYTTGGLDVSLAYTGLNTYSLFITGKGGSTASFTSRTFSSPSGGQVPAQIRFFNVNAGDGGTFDLFFNSLSINNPVITTHPATGGQTLCQGTSAAALSVTNIPGATYQWYRSSSNTSYAGATAVGTNSNSYTPATTSNEVGTNYYYCTISLSCATVFSRFSGAIVVSATSVGGTASSDQTICSNTQPNNITLSGNTGTIQWQRASDASFTSPTNIGTNSTTLTGAQIGTLTATTYIRAVVTNSPCSSANSNTVMITVISSTGGGITASSSSTCLGGSVTLTGTGNNGTTFQWQRSTDNSTWVNITGATSNVLNTPPNTVTTYYRLSVSNGSCAADNSSAATVSITDANTSTAGSTWSNAQNDNTTGLGAWTLSSTGASNEAGFFTGGSEVNGGVTNINTSGRSWGLYANSTRIANADRTITGNLSVGQSMSFHIDNGSIATGSKVGFILRNASGETLTELSYTGNVANTANYVLDDNANTSTSIEYSLSGLEVYIKRVTASTYDISILRKSTGVVQTLTGRTFKNPSGGQVPASVRFYNNNAGAGDGANYYVNNLTISSPVITTQPSTSTQNICKDQAATALSVAASGGGTGFQWYSNSTASNVGGTIITGATSSSYTPPTGTVGTTYYYCEVTGTCGSATSNVSGAIVVNPLPTISSATSGVATAVCYNAAQQTTSLSYSATTQAPTSYSIDWTGMTDQTSTAFNFNAGGGTLTGIIIPAGTNPGTYNGTLTISNANGCTGTLAVSVTVNALPTISTSGTAIAVCQSASAQTTTLDYTATSNLTTGSPTYSIDWNSAANTAGLTDQSSTSQSFTVTPGSITGIQIPANLAFGTYSGTMTITNGNGCTVTQAVSLSITASPTITTSGTITAVCYNAASQTASLTYSATSNSPSGYNIDWNTAANSAGLTDQGNTSFSFISGGGTINTIAIPAGVTAGTYSGTMTVYNGSCSSTQAVSITINALPTITTSGTVTAVCYSASQQTTSMAFTATSGTPVSYSIDWASGITDQGTTGFSFVGGSPVTDIIIPAATAAGTYSGTMTITTASGCTNTQAVSVTINAPASITSSGAMTACYNASAQTTTLVYTGTDGSPNAYSINWDNTANTAGLTDQTSTNFSFASSPITGINVSSGLAAGTYNGVMTINNANGCTSTINVSLVVKAQPTIANAGSDIPASSTCGSTTVTLGANTPSVGAGAWSIVSGSGGSFADASSPTTNFTGTAGTTYILRWTISNSPCTESIDDVEVVLGQSPTTANAGPDQTTSATCGLTSVTLAGNTISVGTGTWSVLSGAGGSFGNVNSPTSTFSGTAGTTYVLEWRSVNGSCQTADSVTITFNRNPTTAQPMSNLSPDCGITTVQLAGTQNTVGNGLWTIESGAGGSFADNTLYNTNFSGTAGVTYTLRWTISNSPCTSSSATVQVTFVAAGASTYYSKSGQSDPNNLNNWTTNSNGTGDNPCGFAGGVTFIVQAGHTYTTSGAWTMNGTVVVNGTLNVNNASTISSLTINNGGLVTANAQTTISSAGTFTIENGGKYVLNHTTANNSTTTFNGTEDFKSNSTFEYQNLFGSSMVSGITYGNLIYNVSGGSHSLTAGNTITINGDLEVKQGSLDLGTARTVFGDFIHTGGTTVLYGSTIKGNYTQTGSGSVVRVATTSDAPTTLTVEGDYELDGGNFHLNNGADQSGSVGVALRVHGDFTLRSGTFNFPTASNTAVVGLIYLRGNCTLMSGSSLAGFMPTSSTSGGFYFEGTGVQTLTTSYAHLPTGVARDAFFYKETGGPTGIIEIYNGTVAQKAISGTFGAPVSGFKPWPGTYGNITGSGATLLQRLIINNSAGVEMTHRRIVNDSLNLISGVLTLPASDSLRIANGQDIYRTGGSLSAAPTFGTSVNVTYGEVAAASITTGPEIPTSTTVLNNLEIYTQNDGVILATTPTVNGTLNIRSNTKLDISASNFGVQIGSGGTFQNNGTFVQRTGAVTFLGSGTVSGATPTTFYNVRLGNGTTNGGGVNFGTAGATIDSTLTVNAGGFVSSNPPKYSGTSRLHYRVGGNTIYGRNQEWSAATGTVGTTAGYPNDVQISNNTILDIPNTGGAFTTNLKVDRDLIVDENSGVYMDYGAGTASGSLTVGRDVTINGMFSLGDAAGGDLYVGRNYTLGAGSTPNGNGYPTYNGRMVSFNGTAAPQTITKTGNGTVRFGILSLDNTASSARVQVASGTNLFIEGATSNNSSARQLRLNTADLDLGAQTLTMNGAVQNSLNIQVNNGVRRIIGLPGSSINITGTSIGGAANLNVIPVNTGTDSLNIDGDATLETSVGVKLTNTIINGIFQINQNGFVTGTNGVAGDAPTYGSASRLVYNNGGPGFNRNFEWTAATGTNGVTPGYPNDIVVQNNTNLNIGSTNGEVTSGQASRGLSGTLRIESGSTVTMGSMPNALIVGDSMHIKGTLDLSTAAGGDVEVKGNWVREAGSTFTPRQRWVRFNGAGTQRINTTATGGETFYNLQVNKTVTTDLLTLSQNVTVDNTCDINAGVLNLASNTITFNALVTKGVGGGFQSASDGTAIFNQQSNGQAVPDFNYGNLTFGANPMGTLYDKVLANSGTIGVSGFFTPRGSNLGHTITGSTISFNGTGSQEVPLFTYNNLSLDGTGAKTTSAAIDVDGNVTINSELNTSTFNHTVAGNWVNNGTFTAETSTIEFNGTSTISGSSVNTYNNLVVSGALTAPNANMNIRGNLNKIGTFTPGTGTVTFNGSASQTITAGSIDFYNMVVDKSGQSLGVANPSMTINVGADMTLQAGQFLPGNATINMTGGNWTNNGATFSRGNSLVAFSGTGDQEIGGSTTNPQEFANVTMNKASGTLSIAENKPVKVDNVLTLTQGTFAPGTGTTVEFDKIGNIQDVPRANYHHLKLSKGGSKLLANEVAVAGDLIVENPTSGTTTVTPGAIIKLNGNNNQAIAGLPFRSVQISGGATKRFTSNASILGAMTFESGSGTVDLDGTSNDLLFTVRSIADSTARIANVNSWTLSGKAVVERYVPAQRKWRLISIPTVPGETLRQALTRQIDNSYPNPICVSPDQYAGSGTLLTGHSFSSCAVANSVGYDHLVNGGASSIRYYNLNASNRWASSSSTPTILAPPTESGYLVFIRGDRKATASGSNVTTLRPKGDLIQGNYPVQIKGQFFVLGNPYASPISFESLWASNQDKLLRKFWVWDANLNNSSNGVGGYRSFSHNGGPSNGYTISPPLEAGQGSVNDYLNINSSQAIMVERNGSASGDVIVQESHKVSSQGNLVNLRTSNDDALGKLEVKLYRASGSNLELLMDGVTARFANWYEAEPTDNYDVYKHNQFEENLSFLRVDVNNVNRWMSIESRPLPTANDTIFMPFYQTTNRAYALKFNAENMATAGLKAYLQDQFTGTETEVPLNGSDMVYPFSVSADANSKALSRLRIVFRPSVITDVVDWMSDKGISIYPNPVVKGTDVQVKFRNSKSGKYDVTIYSLTGVRVLQTQVVHPGGSSVQKATMPAELASGTYIMEFTSPNGDSGKTKLIVQ